MAGRRVVAELGRPETLDETAARKAESSRIYRSSQNFRNLVAAILATFAVVAVVILAVPRGEFPERQSLDPAPVAAEVEAAYGRSVISPDLPDSWRVNTASVASASGGTPAWTIVYVPDDSSFLRFSQAFDADEAWARTALRGTAPDGTLPIGGIDWDVFEASGAAAASNITYALGAQAGADYVLIHGSSSPEVAADLAASVAPHVHELRSSAR